MATLGPVRGRGPHRRCGRGQAEPDVRKTRSLKGKREKIYDKYASKDIRFAVISREETESGVESFWKENGLKMPYSAQNDRDIYEKFAQTRIPRVYICEKGGKIRYIFTDDPNPSYDDIESALENVIR